MLRKKYKKAINDNSFYLFYPSVQKRRGFIVQPLYTIMHKNMADRHNIIFIIEMRFFKAITYYVKHSKFMAIRRFTYTYMNIILQYIFALSSYILIV